MASRVSIAESRFIIPPEREEDLAAALVEHLDLDLDPSEGIDALAEEAELELERDDDDVLNTIFLDDADYEDAESLLLLLCRFAEPGSWLDLSIESDDDEVFLERWTVDEDGEIERIEVDEDGEDGEGDDELDVDYVADEDEAEEEDEEIEE